MKHLALTIALGLMTTPVIAQVKSPVTLAVEQTKLKAKPGMRDQLARYIVSNWFALDRKGVAAGIFTDYRLYENADPAGDWDFIVAVGYRDPSGYDGPGVATRFQAIRAQHRETLIDGKALSDLGTVLGTERLRPRGEG